MLKRNLLGSFFFSFFIFLRVFLFFFCYFSETSPLFFLFWMLNCLKFLLFFNEKIYHLRRIILLIDIPEFIFLFFKKITFYTAMIFIQVLILYIDQNTYVAYLFHPFHSVFLSQKKRKEKKIIIESLSTSSLVSLEPVIKAKATHRFHTTNSSELPLRTNEDLEILSTKGDWWHARKTNDKVISGFIPSNYVVLNKRAIVLENINKRKKILEAYENDVCEIIQNNVEIENENEPMAKVRLRNKIGYLPMSILKKTKATINNKMEKLI